MPQCGFSLTRIFPYKGRIVDFVLIKENTLQRKPVFRHTTYSELEKRMHLHQKFMIIKHNCMLRWSCFLTLLV